MSVVWLLKSSEEGDGGYSHVLTEAGFTPVLVPVLTFQYCNQSTLNQALHHPADHTGIIFTSPRAVQAVAELYKTLPVSCHQEWSNKKIFAIGKATSHAVKTKLGLDCIGEESGNAQQLGPIIIQETQAFDKPLLYPCGNLGRDELPKFLAQHDRDFRALTSYETLQHPQLKQNLQKLKSDGQLPKYMVFFSPSGVNFTLPIFRDLGISVTGVKLVAIGPTTNAALVHHNLPVAGICPSPTPEGVLQVLRMPD